MQKQDYTANNYWDDNERFADIINVAVFNARKVLSKGQLEKADCYTKIKYEEKGIIQGKNTRQSIYNNIRDVVRKVAFNTNMAIVGIENQTEIHNAMPVKVMGYDFSEYKKQLDEIRKEHRKKKDLKGEEFLSGFSKEDRLKAALTLVLYYGEEPWEGPYSLKEILDFSDIPEELKEKVADYPLYIVDVRRFEESEKLETEARVVFGLLQREKDWEAMEEYVEKNSEEFQNLSEEACDLLAAVTRSNDFIKIKENYKNKTTKKERNEQKKGSVDMCEALRQMREKYTKIGREEERHRGLCSLIKICKEFGVSQEEAVERVLRDFSITKEEAEANIEKYW